MTTDVCSVLRPERSPASSGSDAGPEPPERTLFQNLDDWRGSVTFFTGFTGTRPSQELENVAWNEVVVEICPEQVTELEDKKQGLYFVPCPLRDAPLVGKTLEAAKVKAKSTSGKMRSKNHITEAAFLVLDVDGIEKADYSSAKQSLGKDKITFLIYTTHSHGDPEKPGVRGRIIIPLNREVDVEEYRAAWHGFDEIYFDGQLAKADASGANLYQQQGTWCCHPERVAKAKSKRHDAGLADANALILAGRAVRSKAPDAPQMKQNSSESFEKQSDYPEADAEQIAENCHQIKQFRNEKGASQSEPLWYDCLGVVAYCTEGKAKCQEWSSGHAGYEFDATESKIVHRLKTPPTTCEQFRKTNPDGCEGCTQTCNSPISLGFPPKRSSEISTSTVGDDPLSALQERFGLISLSGKIFLLEKNPEQELNFSNRSDGKLLLQRLLRADFPEEKVSNIVENFFVDPETTFYKSIEFNPTGTTPGYLNLWQGPTVKPIKGSWKKIKWFLLHIICNGDKKAWKFLLRYIAHALQHPEVKPGVMIILLGGQGTGKGTLGRILHRIWGVTYLQSNRIDQITGSFNAVLERNFIVFLDEALFVGDRKASDSLKSLVTEPVFQINEKYQPSRQIRSYHRFIAATNAEHFKNTERDDRRDFTLRVSEARKGDLAYWQELHDEIDNGGVEAMAYALMHIDLSDFNVRDKPQTAEFHEQKLLSLRGFEEWWYEHLQVGHIEGYPVWPEFVATSQIVESIKASDIKIFHALTSHYISKVLQQVCPSANSHQKQSDLSRRRGYLLPPLQQARVEFEAYLNCKINWEDDD